MSGYPGTAYRRGSQPAPVRRTPSPRAPSPLPPHRPRRPPGRPQRETPRRPTPPGPRPAQPRPGPSRPLPGAPEPFPRLKSWPRPRRFPIGRLLGPGFDIASGYLIDKYPWLGEPPPWSPFFPEGKPFDIPAGWQVTYGPCDPVVVAPGGGRQVWTGYSGASSCLTLQAVSSIAFCPGSSLCNDNYTLYRHTHTLVPTSVFPAGRRFGLVIQMERIGDRYPSPAYKHSPAAEPMPTRWAIPGWEPVPLVFAFPGGALAPNPMPRPVSMPRPNQDGHRNPLRGPNPINDPGLYPPPLMRPSPSATPVPPFAWPGSPPVPGPGGSAAGRPGGSPVRGRGPRGPGSREREIKGKGTAAAVRLLAAVAYGATEAIDAVRAIHRALPSKYRTKGAGVKQQVRDIIDHYRHIDTAKALTNLLRDQLVDRVVASGIRRAQGFSTEQGVFLGRAIQPLSTPIS